MISIYCSEKLDGVAAASIVMRHATLGKLPAHFGGFLHLDSLEEELEDMSNEEQKLIFVLDVSITPAHLAILEKVNKKNKIVYWNTHDSESVVPPAKMFDKPSNNQCSAELAQQRFLPNDLIAKKLAELAHEVKFWQIKDENSIKLSDMITAQYSPIELIDALARGIIWNEQFETFHKEFLQKKIAALDDLMKSLIIKSYVNYRIAFATAPPILNTADACQKILDGHAGVDVAIVLYRDGRIGFRRRDNCDLDMKKLAELFNGGGRPFAAGAKLKMQITKETHPEVIFHLDETFKNYFLKTV